MDLIKHIVNEKIIQLIIIVGLVVLSSCGNDDDYMLPEVGNECRISGTSFNSQYRYIHHYDDLNRLILRERYKENSHIEDWEYIYNGNVVNVNYYDVMPDGTRTLYENGSYKAFMNSNGSIRKQERKLIYPYPFSNPVKTYTVISNQVFKYDDEGYQIENVETRKYYNTESGDFCMMKKL